MQTIRLLTSIHGDNSPVIGDPGDLLTVADDVADVWADGERAELLDLSTLQAPVVPPTPTVVDLVKQAAQMAPPPVVVAAVPAQVEPTPEPAAQARAARRERTARRRAAAST